MTKLSFICIVCLCATTQINAQMRDTTLNTHKVDANSLLLKSKKQKTAAWILLGGGTGLAITGIVIISKDNVPYYIIGSTEQPRHSAAGPILLIAGTGAVLSSIPLFIASGNNKRKATLMLKDENVFFNPQLNIKDHLIALGVKINL